MMSRVQINEDWRVESQLGMSQSGGWALQKKHWIARDTGGEWQDMTYHHTPEEAIDYWVEYQIRIMKIEGLKRIQAKRDELKKSLVD